MRLSQSTRVRDAYERFCSCTRRDDLCDRKRLIGFISEQPHHNGKIRSNSLAPELAVVVIATRLAALGGHLAPLAVLRLPLEGKCMRELYTKRRVAHRAAPRRHEPDHVTVVAVQLSRRIQMACFRKGSCACEKQGKSRDHDGVSLLLLWRTCTMSAFAHNAAVRMIIPTAIVMTNHRSGIQIVLCGNRPCGVLSEL